MSYELDFGVPPTDAVQSVARGRLDRARRRLKTQPEGLHEAVHEARKDLKRLRALARLVRDGLPRAAYRRANGMARDAGREISALRDATALLETADALDDAFGSAIRDTVTRPLRRTLQAERGRLDDRQVQRDVRAAIERLDVLRDGEISRWTFDAPLSKLFVGGLVRTYRRARSAMRAAREQPTTENLHAWRKRVKYHRYHLKLVRPAWHDVVQAQRRAVKHLSKLLGDDHDLAVLADRLRDGGFDDALDHELLNALILERRAQLQSEAFALGAQAFAEKPKAHGRRLAGYAKARTRPSPPPRATTVEDRARAS